MSRALPVWGLIALIGACGDTTAGKLCQPGSDVCGSGFQCLTFCDKDSGPESICTPSFGDEAAEVFTNQALIDSKVTFGELGNVRRFDRDLRIEITGVKGIALPLVEEVVGNLSIVSTDAECVSLPRLSSVGGVLTIDLNKDLQKNELASLQTVRSVVITDNEKLPSLLLTSARAIGGDVIIDRNEGLSFLNLESLESIGGNFLMRGNALTELHLDALDAVAGCVDIAFDGACSTPPRLGGVECCAGSLRTSCAGCP